MAAPERQFQELNIDQSQPIPDNEQQIETPSSPAPEVPKPVKKRYTLWDILDLVAQKAVLLLTLPCFALIWIYAIRYTEKFKDFEQEYLENRLDSKMQNMLFVVIVVAVFAILAKLLLHGKTELEQNQKRMLILLGISCLYYFVVSVIWVKVSHSTPRGDQYSIIAAAQAFQDGNFESLQISGYMDMAPHQLGLALIIEGLFKVFGNGKYYLYQYLNACFMPLIMLAGYKVTEYLFHNAKVCLYYLFLMVACVQLFFYVPFIYGEIGSIACIMTATWMILAYCNTDKKRNLVGAILASTLAIMIRENSLIFLIAEIVVLAVYLLKKRNPKVLLLIAGLVLGYILMTSGVAKLYEVRSGIERSDGIPATAYIAMGLQDTWPGPGWYNNYNKECYQQAGFITIVADSMAKANIQNRMAEMMAFKAGALNFFKLKIQTQWNEPTYESFWMNYSFGDEIPENSAVLEIFDGNTGTRIRGFMNRYQFLVYTAFLIGLIALLLSNKRDITSVLLVVTILGGFLFSILWEAKSRYILPYFVFMMTYAAYGIYVIQDIIQKMLSRYFAKRPETLDAARIDADATRNDATLGGFDDRRASDKPDRARILRFRNKSK